MKTCACGKCNLDKIELKTLKEIKIFKGGDTFTIQTIVKKEIRREAIKWIKEDINYCGGNKMHPLINRWMKRFNITEEDLK